MRPPWWVIAALFTLFGYCLGLLRAVSLVKDAVMWCG